LENTNSTKVNGRKLCNYNFQTHWKLIKLEVYESKEPCHQEYNFKRRNSNGQKTHEKMLTISSNKGNAN
jgi:hypothetical protein